LAGELERTRGYVARAFAEYERRLMPFTSRKQEAAARFASSFAPRTTLGLFVRNLG
jgi:2-polyprenyl-6-methoxyphenol hydroxylase-like FAD-dependent oxidoreductase